MTGVAPSLRHDLEWTPEDIPAQFGHIGWPLLAGSLMVSLVTATVGTLLVPGIRRLHLVRRWKQWTRCQRLSSRDIGP